MEVNISLLNQNVDDFTQLLNVFIDTFDIKKVVIQDQYYLERILKNDNFIVITAKINQKVIGGLTAYIIDSYTSQTSYIYIYDIAIKEEFQRQGIGKMLINFLKDYASKNEIEEIYVDTELEDNIQAINFYRNTKVTTESNVKQFTYSIKSNNHLN